LATPHPAAITPKGHLNPSFEGSEVAKRMLAAADFVRVTTAAPTLGVERPHAAAELDPAVDELLLDGRERAGRRLDGRSLWSAVVLGAAFLLVATGLAIFGHTHRSPGVVATIGLLLTYAVAARVEFEIGAGAALPTQIVLVPMLLLLPLRFVPLLVCAGLVIGKTMIPGRGRAPLDRTLTVPVNSWHVIGPVAVLLAAHAYRPRLGDWPVYLAALAAQFGVELVVSGGREWFRSGMSPFAQLPFIGWTFAVDTALACAGLLAALAAAPHASAALLLLPLIGLLAMFAREREVRIDHTLELSNAYRGTALLLGDVVEADDEYTGSHSRDVVTLVLDVCDRLGLNLRDRRDAEFTALLHDVGKIKIPAEIINKPGPLTPEERLVIETHTVEGERLLSKVGGILGDVGHVVRSCHEDWDGTGYPDGLAGEDIPLVARIVRVCDAFSAMTSDRPYRKGRPVADAVAELQRCSGTDFDPDVVEALAATLRG
jgi:HD-GYP domain-containing protein (c-di-GMP phosphodiesterase class II)